MSSELEGKLAQLKRLHELGLLTDAELAEQKRAALSAFMGSTPAPTSSLLAGATTVDGPSAAAPASPLAGATTVDPNAGLPSRLGNYRVLGMIGAGGMGTVVRARHEEEGWARRQGGDVALKLIHPQIAADPSFRERFLDEAELGRRVQHPGLARVYDVVMEGPWLGTVLEYVEGKELSEWVKPGGLPVEEVVSLLAPLAEALDHLHSQGIVHRDLKPANVKVRPDGRPVLLDLGIAKDLSGQSGGQTQTMTTMGTSAWMAPEQADAKSVTAAADVYAFGLMAYALLSGRMPWGEGESELRVLTNKMMGRLDPLGAVVPGLPETVSAAVMGALAVDAGARPSSCSALVLSLDAKRQAAETARREAEGRVRREAAARKAAAERARQEAEGRARREEAARKAAAEKARREAEERARRAAAEAARKAAEEKALRAAEEQARREARELRAKWAAAREAAEEKARRQAAEQSRREAAARKAAAERERARREAGPYPHTHRYEGPVLSTVPVERTREVVVKEGFLGFGREVREETYTVHEERMVKKAQERSGERFGVGGSSLVLVTIPAGTYGVGSGPDDGNSDERPKHKVRLSRAYSMGIHPVTHGVYKAVMRFNPAKFSGEADSASRPVETVSWFNAVAFCNRLSWRCGLAPAYRIDGEQVSCDFKAPGFRLPTEHEWEVAARAGTGFKYSGSDELDPVGWFRDNSGEQTHPVGQKAPNSWGLYDLNGNVWEWCWDWFGAYQSGTMADPVGPQSGAGRVCRGGSWDLDASYPRVAYRNSYDPSYRNFLLGLRLARTLP